MVSTAPFPAARLASRALGARPVVSIARLASTGRLPVLAYHDVPDRAIFVTHLDFVQEHYRPIGGSEVAAAVRGGARLPARAIWLTFDDAHAGVFANALPDLAERRLPATLFVCPGVVDTDRPYWWQVLESGLAAQGAVSIDGRTWSDSSVVTHLKTVPDAVRRATVIRVADGLAASGVKVAVPQATTADLRRWLEAGLELGNHTWDHACLDMCGEAQQREQIEMAHDWLRDLLGSPPRLFAYPNGNTAAPSRQVLTHLGYDVAALFDHRLSRARGQEVSRLRIDADVPVRRLAAITSGAHPAAFAGTRRLAAFRHRAGVPA